MINSETTEANSSFRTLCRISTSTCINQLSALNMMFGGRLASFAFVLSSKPKMQFFQSTLLPPTPIEISRRELHGVVRSALSPTLARTALQRESSETRIGIVGGGIAGVTVAHSLASRHMNSDKRLSIVIMEGDSPHPSQTASVKPSEKWIAATARNANSIVPGAAMHLMAEKNTLFQIMRDTVREWAMVYVESFHNQFQKLPGLLTDGSSSEDTRTTQNIDNFDHPPPYFALHLFRCLGTSASIGERVSFVRFLKHFMLVSLLGEAGEKERAECLVQLAKANRAAVRQEIEDGKLASQVGFSQGFLSLYRTHAKAAAAVEECLEHGEYAKLLSWHEAALLEPRLKRLPIKPLFAAHRIQDNSASCELFAKHLIRKCQKMGVEYNCNSRVVDLKVVVGTEKHVFRVATDAGSQRDFDILVLAAGTHSPLLAAKLGCGAACPTYPLRGYSLTFFTPEREDTDDGESSNLLVEPFSVDSMYCSSVSPRMARIAGFGELVGYRDKAINIPSVAPRVLARYARKVFPDAAVSEDNALQCFRPISPDDLPLAGEVSSVPGLFLHTGHGTLGWTLSLATAECVAQAVTNRMEGSDPPLTAFTLPDKTKLNRRALSPDRFV